MLCSDGSSDWRGDGASIVICPCCAIGCTFFDNHGVVIKVGEDGGKGRSKDMLRNCGGAKVQRSVDVFELCGI